MRIIETYIGPATFDASLVDGAPCLTLDFDARCKTRLRAELDDGSEVGLMLPRGTVLRDGDWLVANDMQYIRVRAAPQPVYVVDADGVDLARAAYHLGNRHVPVQLETWRLMFEHDPVLAAMLRGLGFEPREANEPFDPEPGAYGGGHRHDHDDAGGHVGEQLSIEAHAAQR